MFQSDADIWLWPRYNPPRLLVGPLPHLKYKNVYAPDYSKPGIAERIKVETAFVLDQERKRL